MRHNVGAVVKEEKCCSCGICTGVCPVKCIQMKLDQNKVPVPVIDAMLCTHCGLCLDICPGKESFNEALCGEPREKEATVLQAYNGHTKNVVTYELCKRWHMYAVGRRTSKNRSI